MKRLRFFVLALALVVAPTVARSQTATERAVRAVVDSFFGAIRREQWDSATRFVDLAGFEPYLKQAIGNARSALPPRETTVEDIMARDSTMPRAVAEWELAQSKKYAAMSPAFGDMSNEFAGVHSQQELFSLKLPDAVARWLEAKDERTELRESWRRMGCSLADLPQFPGAIRTILAVGMASDSLAYVIHSDDHTGAGPASLYDTDRVFPVRLVNGHWRIKVRLDLMRPINMSFGFDGCPKPKKRP